MNIHTGDLCVQLYSQELYLRQVYNCQARVQTMSGHQEHNLYLKLLRIGPRYLTKSKNTYLTNDPYSLHFSNAHQSYLLAIMPICYHYHCLYIKSI